jgi:hypothetical protein
MKENSGLENIKTIGTVPEFQEKLNDAINNFQALRLSLMTDSYEEAIEEIKNEKMFVPFEDYLLKKDNYVLSPAVKISQKEIIDAYNKFIDRALEAKDKNELETVKDEALKYLKEVCK